MTNLTIRAALLRHTKIAALVIESQNGELDPIDAGQVIINALNGEPEALDMVHWAIEYWVSVWHAYRPPMGSAKRQILGGLRMNYRTHIALVKEICEMTAKNDLRLNAPANLTPAA